MTIRVIPSPFLIDRVRPDLSGPDRLAVFDALPTAAQVALWGDIKAVTTAGRASEIEATP